MRKFWNRVKGGAAVVGAVAGSALVQVGQAHAALTAPTIDTGDFYTIAGAVITAMGVIFAVRKAVGLLSR